MRTDEMLMVQNIHDELMDDIERLRTTLLKAYQFISPHSDPMGSNVQMASEIMAALSTRPAQGDKADALQDSAYIAGMQEGFRLGLDENHEGLASRITARDGYLAPLTRPAPAAEVAGWDIVTDPCMGSARGALQDVLTKWRTWTEFTGAAMGTRKSLDERDVRRREAETRLALAAGTLAWHLDRDPSLLNTPAPAAEPQGEIEAIINADTKAWGEHLRITSYCHKECLMPKLRAALSTQVKS